MGGKNYHGNMNRVLRGALRQESLILSAGTEKSEYPNISITTEKKKKRRQSLSRKWHLKKNGLDKRWFSGISLSFFAYEESWADSPAPKVNE